MQNIDLINSKNTPGCADWARSSPLATRNIFCKASGGTGKNGVAPAEGVARAPAVELVSAAVAADVVAVCPLLPAKYMFTCMCNETSKIRHKISNFHSSQPQQWHQLLLQQVLFYALPKTDNVISKGTLHTVVSVVHNFFGPMHPVVICQTL